MSSNGENGHGECRSALYSADANILIHKNMHIFFGDLIHETSGFIHTILLRNNRTIEKVTNITNVSIDPNRLNNLAL